MTWLPIIERELRVRARRRAGYWTRFGVALGGVLICLPQLLFSGPFGATGTFGKGMFDGIVAAAFLLSCGACLLTAEAITTEQKEGTLGLLFLTRVKALDVLLGKLGSVGLTSLCGLLAFVPIMMIPILAGGVTGGEAFRKGLALFTMLCLALAVGLWAATSSRKSGVARNAVGALLLVVFVPFCFWQLSSLELKFLGVLSPLVALICAGDFPYRSASGWYWTSLLGGNALACLALCAAGLRLRRVTEPEADVQPPQPVPFTLFGKKVAPRLRWTSRQDEASPVAWLVRRQPGVKARLWAAALLALLYQGASLFWYRLFGRGAGGSPMSLWVSGFAISAIGSALMAWATSRFFLEGRRTAAFEVLLTTPVGARSVVAEQWKALQRLLRWPVLLMLLPSVLQLVMLMNRVSGSSSRWVMSGYELQYAVSLAIGTVGLLLHVAALCWLGLWFGLKARGQAGAIAWSVGLSTGGAYLITLLSYGLFGGLASGLFRGPGGWLFAAVSSVPQMMGLLFNLALIRWASNRLRRELAGAAPARFGLKETITDAARDTRAALRHARHWTPS